MGVKTMGQESQFRTSVKNFFRTDSGRLLKWLFIWLIEIFILWQLIERKYFSATVMSGIKIVSGVVLVFLLFFWLREKISTEYLAYFFLIIEFMFFNLYKESVFAKITGQPFWILYVVLLAYFLFRVLFPFYWFYDVIKNIFGGLREAGQEDLNERIQRHNILVAKRREQRIIKEKFREQKNKERESRWESIGSSFLSFFAWLIDVPRRILFGLGRSKSKYVPPKRQNSEDGGIEGNDSPSHNNINTLDERIIYFSLSYLFVPMVFVIPIVIAIILLRDSSLLSELVRGGDSAEQITKSLIQIFVAGTILIIVLSVLSSIILNVVVQIHIFIIQMKKDLISALNDQDDRSITSNVLYAMTIGILLYWLSKHYPFSLDDLAVEINNGNFITYPIAIVLLTILISFFTKGITVAKLKEKLNSTKTNKVITDLFDIAINVIAASVNYLKIVTSDFLLSIQELAYEEDLEDDLTDEGEELGG